MFKLIGTNEILGALASGVSENEKQAIINDIEAEVITVKNTDDEVHLALPYYAAVEGAMAQAISDAETAEVAGGEIGISIAVAIGVLGVVTTGAYFAVDTAVKKSKGEK